MYTLVTKTLARNATIAVLTLLAAAGCTSTSITAGPAATSPPVLDHPESSPSVTAPTTPTAPPTTKPATTSTWPSPEDCVSYEPSRVTVEYEAGIYAVLDGSTVVMRLPGGPGENVGEQGLALAKRYRKHCYIGRQNNREEHNAYVFDYWRSGTGVSTTIPDEQDSCSNYNRNNLTVEDMGDGNGWRVKDHDHVLHLFDNESDARNGKLVLAKSGQICFLGSSVDDDPALVSYLR